jgi:hypothetical protein
MKPPEKPIDDRGVKPLGEKPAGDISETTVRLFGESQKIRPYVIEHRIDLENQI